MSAAATSPLTDIPTRSGLSPGLSTSDITTLKGVSAVIKSAREDSKNADSGVSKQGRDTLRNVLSYLAGFLDGKRIEVGLISGFQSVFSSAEVDSLDAAMDQIEKELDQLLDSQTRGPILAVSLAAIGIGLKAAASYM
jgi:hypothetical protein